MAVAAGVVPEADPDTSLRDVLAAALEANERLARLAEVLRAENAWLREAATPGVGRHHRWPGDLGEVRDAAAGGVVTRRGGGSSSGR